VTVPTAAIAMSAPVPAVAEFERLEARLMVEFSPPLRAEEVQRCLVACVTKHQSATVRNYVSIFIEREARGRLRALCEVRE
jgi:hypothetical protein